MNFRNTLIVLSTLVMTLGSSLAMASEEVAKGDPYGSLASALAIGVAAFGGALGQGKTAAEIGRAHV